MIVRLSLAALALTATSAGLISADSSSAMHLHHRVSLSSLYHRADSALDNGPLTANFALTSIPAPGRHTLPPVTARPIIHQPYPPLAR